MKTILTALALAFTFAVVAPVFGGMPFSADLALAKNGADDGPDSPDDNGSGGGGADDGADGPDDNGGGKGGGKDRGGADDGPGHT